MGYWTALSPDARWLVTSDDKGAARWRDFATGVESPMDLALNDLHQIAFSPDGRQLTAISRSGTGSLWDVAARQKVADLRGFLMGMYSTAFTPDSRRLAIGSSGGEAVKIFDLASQRELLTLEATGAIYHSVHFSPDGNLLAASDAQGTLSVWRAPPESAVDADPQ